MGFNYLSHIAVGLLLLNTPTNGIYNGFNATFGASFVTIYGGLTSNFGTAGILIGSRVIVQVAHNYNGLEGQPYQTFR